MASRIQATCKSTTYCSGTANRAKSEQYGLKVWLCVAHHTGGNMAVHQCRERDVYLKKIAQAKFEETHDRSEFIKEFGKSYILN